MRVLIAIGCIALAGCGDDAATTAPPDLSAAAPHDLAMSLGCEVAGHSQRCAPVGLVCSLATDASPYQRCFCDPWGGGNWRCGDCRVFPQYQPSGPQLPFNFPGCMPVDDGCTQPWGEWFYTCRCMPDGSGRCCAEDTPDRQAACFSVDGG
ncbi:MAG TPA: hypothetical protein VF334_13405 [Polyangia bacterium]